MTAGPNPFPEHDPRIDSPMPDETDFGDAHLDDDPEAEVDRILDPDAFFD